MKFSSIFSFFANFVAYAIILLFPLQLFSQQPAAPSQEELQRQYQDFQALGNEFYNGLSSVWTSHSMRAQYCKKFVKEKNRHEFWTRSAYQSMLASFDMLRQPDSIRAAAVEWLQSFPNDPYALATISYYALYYNFDNADPLSLSEKAATLIPNYQYHIFFTEKHYKQYFHGLYNLVYSTWGWSLAEKGLTDSAQKVLYKGLRETPSTLDDMYSPAPYHYALGRTFEKMGNADSALHHYAMTYRWGEGRNRWTQKALSDFSRLHNKVHSTAFPVHDSLRVADSTLYKAMKPYLKHTGFYFTDITSSLISPTSPLNYVAWGDANNDSRPDLLLNGSIILTNKGGDSFAKDTLAQPLARGGVWIDWNADGNMDIYAFRYGQNTLLQGNGKGAFSVVTGAEAPTSYQLNTEAVIVTDWNNDGFQDLYVVNHEVWSPNGSVLHHDELWENIGGTSFGDITSIEGATQRIHAGRGGTSFDYDSDGDNDIIVSNYRLHPNYLLQNNFPAGAGGKFTEIAESAGIQGTNTQGVFGHSTGTAVGDYDGDGKFDIFIANMCHPRFIDFSDFSMLYKGLGTVFQDMRRPAGIVFEETQTDAVFADFNGDGNDDLFVTSTYEDRRNMLFLNNGNGTFTESAGLVNLRSFDGFGCAVADYDNDGDIDIAIGTGIVYQTGVRIFKNMLNDNPATKVHWLQIKVSSKNNPTGYGAIVTAKQHGKVQRKVILGSRGVGSQDYPAAYFGFGKNDSAVEIEVRMPGSDTTVRKTINKLDTVVEVEIP